MEGLRSQAQEKEIDGVLYEAWPVPFSVGMPMLKRMIDIIGPIATSFMREKEAGIFATLPTAFTDKDVAAFAKQFGSTSRVKEGENWVPLVEAKQNTHFAGKYLQFLQWLTFCCEVNFKGFFSGLKGADGIGSLLAMAKE